MLFSIGAHFRLGSSPGGSCLILRLLTAFCLSPLAHLALCFRLPLTVADSTVLAPTGAAFSFASPERVGGSSRIRAGPTGLELRFFLLTSCRLRPTVGINLTEDMMSGQGVER
jgi:hypothetical protein